MPSREQINHSIVLKNDFSEFPETCKNILALLKNKNFSENELFSVHLALEEAFANAVKHGNKNDPKKQVRIEYAVDNEKIEIRITDQGQGFNPAGIADPRCEENIYKAYGRGVLLINSYMDEVHYLSGGTCIHMVKYKKELETKK